MARRTTQVPMDDDAPPVPADRPQHKQILIQDGDIEKERPKPPKEIDTTNSPPRGRRPPRP